MRQYFNQTFSEFRQLNKVDFLNDSTNSEPQQGSKIMPFFRVKKHGRESSRLRNLFHEVSLPYCDCLYITYQLFLNDSASEAAEQGSKIVPQKPWDQSCEPNVEPDLLHF